MQVNISEVLTIEKILIPNLIVHSMNVLQHLNKERGKCISAHMEKNRVIKDLCLSFSVLSIFLIICSIGSSNIFNLLVYGHNFVPNESASFISFMNQLEVESDLVQTNLADGTATLAKEHATRAIELLNSEDPVNNIAWIDEIAERNQRVADELVTAISALENMTSLSFMPPSSLLSADTYQSASEIDAIINEAITSRIDNEQLTNSTIQATAVGDIINTLLRYYGNAYTVGFDIGNMSQIPSGIERTSSNRNYTLVNITDYQSAQALAKEVQEIFSNDLRFLTSSNATDSISRLEEKLVQLNNSIDNKSSPIELMKLGHTQVHPNLQAAFNLKLQMKK